ncbi:hypothetical protein D3C73_987860 [compost metagenome]
MMVLISNLLEWYWPTQSSSYSVIRPKGAPTPRPMYHCSFNCHEAYRLGTTPRLPASPPLPPVGTEPFRPEPGMPGMLGLRLSPLSLNLNDGLIRFTPPEKLTPGRYVMPAGL